MRDRSKSLFDIENEEIVIEEDKRRLNIKKIELDRLHESLSIGDLYIKPYDYCSDEYIFSEGTKIHVMWEWHTEIILDHKGYVIEINKVIKNYKEYLKTDKWKKKREEAFNHYGNCCALCSSDKNINIHHRNYDNLGKENVKTDLIVLCQECHEIFHERCK